MQVKTALATAIILPGTEIHGIQIRSDKQHRLAEDDVTIKAIPPNDRYIPLTLTDKFDQRKHCSSDKSCIRPGNSWCALDVHDPIQGVSAYPGSIILRQFKADGAADGWFILCVDKVDTELCRSHWSHHCNKQGQVRQKLPNTGTIGYCQRNCLYGDLKPAPIWTCIGRECYPMGGINAAWIVA